MTNQLSFTDITANRHRGNPQSVAAQRRRQPVAADQRRRVLNAIRDAGLHGLSVDELSEAWGVPPNAVSGRFSELKRACKIVKTGLRPTRSGGRAGVFVSV